MELVVLDASLDALKLKYRHCHLEFQGLMLRKLLACFAAVLFCTLMFVAIDGARHWMAVDHLENREAVLSDWVWRWNGDRIAGVWVNGPIGRGKPLGNFRWHGYYLQAATSPRTVFLNFKAFDESMVRDLRALGGVDWLSAEFATGLSPAMVDEIAGMSSVKRLELDRSDVTDEGLNLLWRKLPELRRVSLGSTWIGDDGLKDVGLARNLEELVLEETDVTDLTVERLRGLPVLRYLNLERTRISVRSADVLAVMPALERVELPDTAAGNRTRERLLELNPKIDGR